MTGHVTATRPLPHVPGHVPGHVMSHVPGCVGTFDHGNLPRLLALRHSRRPFALWHPRPLLPLWPMATLSSWPTPFVNHGRWRPSSLGGPRLLAASNLRRPLAHGAPLATIGYQGVVVIRNGRVIEPIVRGGGHGGRGGRGGHSGLGGMSWWCGGMSWKVVREKGEGSWGVVRSRCHGLTYPPREGPARGIAPSTSARGPRALLPRISVSVMAAWQYLARGVSALIPLAGYDKATDARGSGRGRNIGYRLCTLVVP